MNSKMLPNFTPVATEISSLDQTKQRGDHIQATTHKHKEENSYKATFTLSRETEEAILQM